MSANLQLKNEKNITGQMLHKLRKADKYTQKQIADYIHVKQGTYSTYENGRTELPIEILVRLSYLYNISIDAIVQRDRLY